MIQFDESERRLLEQGITTSIRHYAPKRTRIGADSVRVIVSPEGKAKVSMKDYMWYQNNGFKAFIMRSLAGKNVPITLPGGRVIFRRVTEQDIGAHRITSRDDRTGRITKGNKPIAWRHPGLPPKRFVQRGINENAPLIARVVANQVLGQVRERMK